MATYIVGRMRIHNRDWMDCYFATVPEIIKSYGGEFLARDPEPERLEGDEELPDIAFVLKFPTRQAAVDFWNSDEFAPFVKLRQTGSTLQALLYSGL